MIITQTTQSHSVLTTASPEAHVIADLWWWMLAVGGTVWLLVTVMSLLAARRKRTSVLESEVENISDDRQRSLMYVIAASAAATIAILLTLLVFDFTVGRKLIASTSPGLTINVSGHQWWWEFTYKNPSPDSEVIVANELHVPIGIPVQFTLNASDVIHSFWLPSMNGKRDLVPGRKATLQFQADTVGVYRGQCAEFCGMQHAKMAFTLIAESRDDFDKWLAHQRSSAVALDSAVVTTSIADSLRNLVADGTITRGREIFLSRSCATCHAIRGTDAGAHVAPDLTHFGSRSTIAAGSVPNTFENLARWIASPDRIKPGTQMPATPLTPQELRALTTYVESLR